MKQAANILAAAALIVMVTATGTLRAQDLNSEIKSDSVRTYLNIGTKYFTHPPLSNQVRPDSDYVVRIATLNTIKKLLDTLHSLMGGTQGLNSVLAVSPNSNRSISLGKVRGLHPYGQCAITNDSINGFKITIADTASSRFVTIGMSSGFPFMSVDDGGVVSCIASDNAIAGKGGGVSTDHLCGSGPAPSAFQFKGSGNPGMFATVGTRSTDLCGVITFTTGLSPNANDTVLRISYTHAYLFPPQWIKIEPANDAAADAIFSGEGLYVPDAKSFVSQCFVMSRLAALNPSTVYMIRYFISR